MRPASVRRSRSRDVFRGTSAVRAGLLTPNQLRGRTWRRLFPEVYVHAAVPVTHLLRVEAAIACLPGAVVTGRSAALLWGVDLARPDDDVEVTLPPGTPQRRIPGLVVRRARLRPQDRWRRLGLPVTTAEATAVRLAALLPGDDAVAAVDQLVSSGVVDLGPVRARAAIERGPGSARAREACALADGLAQSPRETWLRLTLQRAGLPAPIAQYRIVHAGRFLARVDFAWAPAPARGRVRRAVARRAGTVRPGQASAQSRARRGMADDLRDRCRPRRPAAGRRRDRCRARCALIVVISLG